jgi:signal transduction histidine kinase
LPRRLATRLLVWFIGLFVLTLGVVIVLSIFFANRRFDSSLDEQLSGTAHTVEERTQQGSEAQRILDELATAAQFLQLTDPSGTPTVLAANLQGRPLPTFISARTTPAQDGFHTIRFRKTEMRLVRHSLHDGDDNLTGYVIVGALVSGRGQNMFDLTLVMVSASLAGLIVVAGGAVIVIKRETTPLRQLTDDVLQASETGFDEPVSASGPGSQEAKDLRRAFSALVDSQRELIERERSFFADSSHVLRTPLSVISGNIELLEQGIYGKERQEAVAQARSAIDTMSRTVSGLLLLSREPDPNALHWEVVDVQAMLRDLGGEAATAFPHVALSADAVEPLEVAGNPYQLRDMFTSLIENACRYTPQGGAVTLHGVRDGQDALISVADTGIGFSEEEGAKATDRFYRGAAARRMFPGGSGLGLAIAERIAALHNGTLTLANDEPAGAVVSVRLPLLG